MSKLRIIFALVMIVCICASLMGCTAQKNSNIVATTLPVYDMTTMLCEGTGLTVSRLITEDISCLHDYTLQVSQIRMIEGADIIVMSGAGLEAFLEDTLVTADKLIDASSGIPLLCFEGEHDHEHEHEHERGHSHEHDPHIWLDPAYGKQMAQNIFSQLTEMYPEHAERLLANLVALEERFDQLSTYAASELNAITHRELITFHDGFAYLAQAYDLTILRAIEEESGSEASAAELIELITMVNSHQIPAIFTERSGSTSSAKIIAAETGRKIYSLDMAMTGDSYFEAMYHNIDTLKEALG